MWCSDLKMMMRIVGAPSNSIFDILDEEAMEERTTDSKMAAKLHQGWATSHGIWMR